MIPDADIKALCRRLDQDQDGDVSFADFFSSVLPYFIYGNIKVGRDRTNMIDPEKYSKPNTLKSKLYQIQ